jgi:hypothetical protein
MIDWELSHAMGIGIDLATICFHNPRLAGNCLAILREFSTAGCVPPEHQLTIGLARLSLRFAEIRAAAQEQRSRGQGLSAEEAEFHATRHDKMRDLMRAVYSGQTAP